MADFRWDPVNGQWVIIAENRAGRPNDFERADTCATIVKSKRADCPFCYGNEAKTPKEIAAYQTGDKDGRWLTRVFSNKYPAVHENGGVNHQTNVGPYRQGDFLGHHEIIVESPEHKTSFSQLSDEEIDAAFKAYRDRIALFANDSKLSHAMLFKNCRPEAGASIEHLHSQILCTSITTEKVLRRVDRAKQYFEANHVDVISAVVDFEVGDGSRIIEETENFVAFCPYASRFGYLTSVTQKSRGNDFFRLTDDEVSELGRFIRKLVIKLENKLPDAAYNMLLHIAPFDISADEYYQWHVEIFPRLANPAGYEWGTGCWINPVTPEHAAESLRNSPDVI